MISDELFLKKRHNRDTVTIALRQATQNVDTNFKTTLQLLLKLVHNFSELTFFQHTLSFTRLTSRIGHSVNTPELTRSQPKRNFSTYGVKNKMVTVKSKAQKPKNYYSNRLNVVPPPIQLN